MLKRVLVPFLVVPLLVIALTLGCAAQQKQAAVGMAAVTIPFELVDNRVIVDVTVNGKPFKALLDTGANAAMSNGAAKELGLSVADAGSGSGVGEQQVKMGRSTVKEFSVGGQKFEGVEFLVAPFDDMPPVFGTKHFDFLFGNPLYERYVVTADYIAKTLTLHDAKSFSYKGSGTVLHIERPQGIPVIDAKLDGVAGRFGVDTGARSALIVYGPFGAKNKLAEKYGAHVEGVTGWGLGGPVRSLLARAKSLEMGATSVQDIVIRLSTQKGGLTTGSSMDGLIGPDVLKQFMVTFDYSRKQMMLEKNANYGKRNTWDRLGAWLGQQGDHFVVIDVIDGSAAAKGGLKKDDEVLAVEGKRAADLVLPELRDQMKTLAVGTKVKMLVRSAGKEREVEFTLADLV
jgi:hypothetical protein